MANQTTFRELLDHLNDRASYTLFLTGKGSYEGSFRIDRCRGSDIKHSPHLFESYREAEIYPEPPEGEEEQRRAAEAVIPHRIEQAIKDRYRQLYGDRGVRARSFEVMRVTGEGQYRHEDMDGDALSRDLKRLVRDSRTVTIVEKGSRAERLFHATLASTGNVRLHPREMLFTDLSDEEKELLAIDGVDADSEGLADLREENVAEHHPD